MSRPWTLRERERAASAVMGLGFVHVRVIARKPELVGDTATALHRIQMIADICHNLPGAARWRPRRAMPVDPFVYAWRTADPEQREWLSGIFQELRLDTAWLDEAPFGLTPRTRRPARFWTRRRADQRR